VFDDQKWEKNLQLKKNLYFLSNLAIYLSLGLYKGRPSNRRSLQPSKENIKHFKTSNFLTFSLLVGHFCPLRSGSGSETLLSDNFRADRFDSKNSSLDKRKPCLLKTR
jgi:hypothetical protein